MPKSRSKKPCAAAVPGEAAAVANTAARIVQRDRIIRSGSDSARLPNTGRRGCVWRFCHNRAAEDEQKQGDDRLAGSLAHSYIPPGRREDPSLVGQVLESECRKPGRLSKCFIVNSHGPSCFEGSARSA
jgi:hypothetical protein